MYPEEVEKIEELLHSKDLSIVKQGLHVLEFVAMTEEELHPFIQGSLRTKNAHQDYTERYPHGTYISLWLLAKLCSLDVSWAKERTSITAANLQELPNNIQHANHWTHIELPHFRGEDFPIEILNFPNLQTLLLYETKIKTLPDALSECPLVTLQYTHQPIPKNIMRGALATTLRELDISHGMATELPAELTRLYNLRTIRLHQMRFTTLPPLLAQIPSLEEIHMEGKRYWWRKPPIQLTPEIARLPNLRVLNLEGYDIAESQEFLKILFSHFHMRSGEPQFCNVMGFDSVIVHKIKFYLLFQYAPPEFCAGLEELDFSHCELDSLPNRFSLFPNLRRLNLAHNQLRALPSDLNHCTKLIDLNVSHNRFTSLNTNYVLPNLQKFQCSHNELQDLPAFFHSLPSDLSTIDLSYNQLSTIPTSLARFTHVQHLNLSRNPIKSLPSFVKDWPLASLFLKQTDLSEIDPTWERFVPPPELHRGRFQFSKHFLWPHQLRYAYRGISLWKYFDSIDPQQPPTIPKLDLSKLGWTHIHPNVFCVRKLVQLSLANNRITSLPDRFAQLTDVHTLNLRGNQITEIPTSLGAMRRLKRLYLRDNQITTFPSFLSENPKLEHLSMEGNQLTNLPKELWSFPSLKTIICKSNRIETIAPMKMPHAITHFNIENNPISELDEEVASLQARSSHVSKHSSS
ncbi:MAG: leucine-rich repeat domain-containing protein [Myxococcota bacterium]|nr:leucine-rich repeat domain-containing protein [Myxococcota bacterium]